MEAKRWDAASYDAGHAYVWQRAADLVALLDPREGERILDVGAGTGHLTAAIARSGATVVGIDSSAEMVRQATGAYPGVTFEVADAAAFAFDQPFDAVFSNAALHWVTRAAEAAACMAGALRPGGRFVAEFGGAGNVARVQEAIGAALAAVGGPAVGGPAVEAVSPWYFPSVAQYAGLLESVGLEVTLAHLFERPTPVEGGITAWVNMFGTAFLGAVPDERRGAFFARLEEAGKPLERDGVWLADYRRLRVVAVRRD